MAMLLPQQVLGASIEDVGGDALSPALWDLHSIAGTACTRSHLEALWEEMQTIGVDVPEVVGDTALANSGGVEFKRPVKNLAEGGTK